LIENNNEDALEVLHSIIQKRTKELQRKDPEVDVTDALKSIILSLIQEGVNLDRLLDKKKRAQMPLKESKEQEKEDSDFDVWIEGGIQKFMNEEVNEDNTSEDNITTNLQEDEGEELLFLMTTKVGDTDDKHPTKNVSIKVITLIEKDKVPIKVDDTSEETTDEKDQSTEEDREIEPQQTKSTVVLQPKASKRIPVLKPNTLKKNTSMGIEERVKENAKRDGFEYMCFRNIPTSLQDFQEKERSWKGFEKALEVIGLNSRKVLARLEKGQPPYENLHKQHLKC
jgi:hypothetical protein